MKADYWISLEGSLVIDPTLPPPAKYRWSSYITHWGFEHHNDAWANSDLSESTDTDHFKVMVF
jgi:hypothetical protein